MVFCTWDTHSGEQEDNVTTLCNHLHVDPTEPRVVMTNPNTHPHTHTLTHTVLPGELQQQTGETHSAGWLGSDQHEDLRELEHHAHEQRADVSDVQQRVRLHLLFCSRTASVYKLISEDFTSTYSQMCCYYHRYCCCCWCPVIRDYLHHSQTTFLLHFQNKSR